MFLSLLTFSCQKSLLPYLIIGVLRLDFETCFWITFIPISYIFFFSSTCYQVNVVHVCEQTLTNRLIEFEKTESAHLTVSILKV